MRHITDLNEIREAISKALKSYVKDQNISIQRFCKIHGFHTGNMYSYLGSKRKGFEPDKMIKLCDLIGLEYISISGLRVKDATEAPAPPKERVLEEIHNRRLILETLSEEYKVRSDSERLELLKVIISNIHQSHQQDSIKTALNQLSLSILNELK